MRKFALIGFAALLGIGSLFVDLSLVFAQEQEFTLEEITVTAEKRTTNIQDTPTAISAVTGDTLIEESAVSIMDVMKNIPNITPMASGGGNNIHIAIRGIGSDLPSGESSVSINFDGSANNNSALGYFGYVDLDRVEVLRGPQGTLYGRNAETGVVNVVTKNPNVDKISGYSVFEMGSYKLLREEGAINVPINDKFAARIAFSNINREGWMIYGSADSVGTAVRSKIGFYPSDDVSVIFTASSTKLGGVGPNTAISLADWEAGLYHHSVENPPYNKQDKRFYTFNMNINVAAGPGVITFIPNINKTQNRGWGAARGDNPALPEWMTNLVMNQSISDNSDKSAELRYAADADARIQWLMGLYYYDQSSTSAPTTRNPLPVTSGTETNAVFGQVTYPFTDAFRAIGGARWAKDLTTYRNENRIVNGKVQDLSEDFGGVTWKMGFEADLAEDVLSYLTVATSRKPGGLNTGDADGGKLFKEENVTSYEAGVKSRLLDKRLQLNASLFYSDYKGFQAIDAYFDDNNEMQMSFFNVDKTICYGAEFESEALIGDATRLNMSISYLHNRYESSYVLHDRTYGDLVDVDLNGRPLSHAPAWSVIAGVEHTFILGESGTLKPRVSGRWYDEQYVGVFPNDAALQVAYAVFDANMLYATASGNWTLNLYMKNVFDEVYKAGFNSGMVMVSEPRMSGVTLNIKF
jgi:iron complex outermembrane recepter protein